MPIFDTDAMVARMLEAALPILAPIIPAIILLIMIKCKKPMGMFIMSGILFVANFRGYLFLRIVQEISDKRLAENIGYVGTVIIITIASTILCIFGVVKGSMLYKLDNQKGKNDKSVQN